MQITNTHTHTHIHTYTHTHIYNIKLYQLCKIIFSSSTNTGVKMTQAARHYNQVVMNAGLTVSKRLISNQLID